jgi:DNA polymerase (family 10)
MNNKKIAGLFKLLANLMELYNENSFKVKQYENAYNSLRKIESPLFEMPTEEIIQLPGIGKSIAQKIEELKQNESIKDLQTLLDKTPSGIVDMLKVRGLGPKKIKSIWQEMNIDNIGDLLLACNENRLVAAKGFGQKTQESIKSKLEFTISSSGKYLYASILPIAEEYLKTLQTNKNEKYAYIGSYATKSPVVDQIKILTTDKTLNIENIINEDGETGFYKDMRISHIEHCSHEEFYFTLIEQTTDKLLFEKFNIHSKKYDSEEEIFEANHLPFIDSELRSNPHLYDHLSQIDSIVKLVDIKGVIHNHSTYSDGLHSIEQMAQSCKISGYEYLVMSDHSVSAFYANGLNEDRLEMQWREIDNLNDKYKDFKIFKSIEADILNDGRLDYNDNILGKFDLVIASIHSNLEMPMEKATSRIIKAIENPYTDILGHPTGRLLLGRKGYELDMKKVIDACSANDVVIELNCNPQRMDMDWEWFHYASEKEVMISINPDAHSIDQIEYIKYGVLTARKGLLLKEKCLNAKSIEEFQKWLSR